LRTIFVGEILFPANEEHFLLFSESDFFVGEWVSRLNKIFSAVSYSFIALYLFYLK